MALLAYAALLALSAAPDDDWGPSWDAPTVEDASALEHRLRGHVLPSVLDFEDATFALQIDGIEGGEGALTQAVLHAFGEIAHPLEGEIRDLSLAIVLLPDDELDRTYTRLTDPPLSLTEEDLQAPLPRPVAFLGEGEIVVEHIETGARATFDTETNLGDVPVDAAHLPGFLVVVDRYTLELPTANDVVTILERGGTADFAALAEWAGSFHDERVALSPEERALVMRAVLAGFRRMRSPPALGDLQRLFALDRLIQVVAGPDDLEPILRLERSIKILHAAAVLAYDGNLREEAMLGVPLHGMDRLPARSDFLVAPDLALAAMRPAVLDRLLMLAFDPADFRDAPRSAMSRSRLRREAAELLSPLQPTDVHGVLEAAADADVQREALRFYVRARHAPVVEPLVTWLIAHPEAFDDLGRLALRELPSAMLPAVTRAYVDPAEPDHRALLRDYLEAMPPELAPQLLEALRALGLDVTQYVHDGVIDIMGVLDAFEGEEARLARRRAAELVERIADNGVEPTTLRASLSAITRLAQLDQRAVEANADLVIEVLSAAAWEFDQESPGERTKALGLLRTMPFGARATKARRAAVLVEARLAARDGDGAGALELLVAHDPTLAHEDVRAAWVETMHRVLDQRLDAGRYDAARELLDQAEALVAQDVDVPELRRRLEWRRYRAAIVVGSIFAFVLVASVGGLLLRAAMGAVARRRGAKREMDRLIRRQQDAEASAQPLLDEVEPDAPTKLLEPVEDREDVRDEPEPAPEAATDRRGLGDVFDDWGDGDDAFNDDGKRVS